MSGFGNEIKIAEFGSGDPDSAARSLGFAAEAESWSRRRPVWKVFLEGTCPKKGGRSSMEINYFGSKLKTGASWGS